MNILDFNLHQNTDPTHDDINEHIKTMNSVILDAAKKCFFIKKNAKNKPHQKHDNTKDCYNKSYKAYRI